MQDVSEPSLDVVPVIADAVRGAHVTYERGLITEGQSRLLWKEFEARSGQFEQGSIISGGRVIPSPRLAAAYGDMLFAFPDMGASAPWFAPLATLKSTLEQKVGQPFNYALVNWYRDGRDFTGWHSDKMHLHVAGSSVAVVSLGAARILRFRHLPNLALSAQICLEDRSLLMMKGATQMWFEHSLPSAPEMREPRISITFRLLLESVQP